MKRIYLPVSLALLITVTWVSLNSGVVKLNGALKLLFGNGNPDEVIIMQDIRAPRVFAAILVGATLGIAGALSQGALRNPLAEPLLLGTSGGAALFTLLGILLFKFQLGSPMAVLMGVIGAIVATISTYLIGKRGVDGFSFVVMGIAVSATLTSLVGITSIMINKPEAKGVTFWTLGTLSMVTRDQVLLLLPLLVITSVASIYLAPTLDYLGLGDLRATLLGKNVQRIRFFNFLIISISIGAITSVFGQIAFLALAIPHIARALIGVRHRPMIILSGTLGATLLLVADLAARNFATPNELPIGLMTSAIGAPILIVSVRKRIRNNA